MRSSRRGRTTPTDPGQQPGVLVCPTHTGGISFRAVSALPTTRRRRSAMPRLRTVTTREPGWKRVRHGRGHRYLDVDGTTPLSPEDVARVKALVIPPAWSD